MVHGLIICFGAFIALLLETGMVKSLGVLLPAMRDEFSTDTWVIGSVISLMPGYGIVTCKSNYYTLKHKYPQKC